MTQQRITTTATVGELAATLPHAARVFERFGIDYCCGGETPLIEACKSAKAAVSDVLTAINTAVGTTAPGRTYSDLTQRELIDHIVGKHHTFTRTEIQRLVSLVEKVVSVHGSRHPELLSVQKVFDDLANDLIPHLAKEETILFPYIAALDSTQSSGAAHEIPPFITVQNPVRMMFFEHDLAGRLLQELRRLTAGFAVPDDVCASYKNLYAALENFEQDLHQHIHLENNLLFPRAIEMESSVAHRERTAM
jgi:regulator of cell morphogenesis and NO signaling